MRLYSAYTPPDICFDRYYVLAKSQQTHYLLPVKQFNADHRFMSLNRHLREQAVGLYGAV